MDFVRDNASELVPEETFTHSHRSWLSVIPYMLPPSVTDQVLSIAHVVIPQKACKQEDKQTTRLTERSKT